MSLKFLCLELRENLKCANVFLQFEKNVEELQSLKINLNKDKLLKMEIEENGNYISVDLSKYFSFDTQTLSNLVVEKLNASFRINVHDFKDIEGGKTNDPNKMQFHPLFRIGEQGNLVCSHCTHTFMNLDTIVRTNEFPMGAIDSGEFFCHAAPEFKNLLIPRICDFFYGFDFVVVNYELLEENTTSKAGYIHCGRCMQHLGEILFNGKAAKLWVDSIKLHREEQENQYTGILTEPTIPRLMHRVVKDCTDIDLLHSMNLAKVIFSASVSNETTKYLMVQILERQLKILRNETPFVHNNPSDHEVVREVQLTECNAFKVLYKYVEEQHSGPEKGHLPAILQFWQQNICVQSLQISPTIFNSLLQQVEENSLIVPVKYRHNEDGLATSYVFYKE